MTYECDLHSECDRKSDSEFNGCFFSLVKIYKFAFSLLNSYFWVRIKIM